MKSKKILHKIYKSLTFNEKRKVVVRYSYDFKTEKGEIKTGKVACSSERIFKYLIKMKIPERNKYSMFLKVKKETQTK